VDGADLAALAMLQERYLREVFRYVLRRVPRHEEAEDITAEVFAAAFAALPQFRGQCPPYLWLLTIARRKIIDARRRRMARRETLASELADEPTAANEIWQGLPAFGGLEAELTRAEARRVLRELIADLNPDQQQLLAYLDGDTGDRRAELRQAQRLMAPRPREEASLEIHKLPLVFRVRPGGGFAGMVGPDEFFCHAIRALNGEGPVGFGPGDHIDRLGSHLEGHMDASVRGARLGRRAAEWRGLGGRPARGGRGLHLELNMLGAGDVIGLPDRPQVHPADLRRKVRHASAHERVDPGRKELAGRRGEGQVRLVTHVDHLDVLANQKVTQDAAADDAEDGDG
jgi:RNA polymerase sigma factor (sigma-70 family)